MRRVVIALLLLACAAGVVWVRASADSSSVQSSAPVVYTSSPRYDRDAWLRGEERFPAGAQVMVKEGSGSRELAGGFAATADAAVSFDGTRVLFAAKKSAQDSWQVWEVAVAGGEAKQITKCAGDCVRPFYLPGGRLVYAEKLQGRFVLQSAEFESGKTLQLSYSPGNAMPTDVLRDGRILFEAAYPMGSGTSPEIYTVYSDGSGVESYRCDHGPKREAGKQSASGDIVFATEQGLGRFTSALAHQVEVKAPSGEFAGDAVQVSPDEWLVAWRPDGKAKYSLQKWNTVTGSLTPVDVAEMKNVSEDNAGPSTPLRSARNDKSKVMADVVQPTVVAPRPMPNQHPSGLHERSYANLLCLNAYTSKYKFAPGSVAAMKLYTADDAGKAKLLGSSPVEADGSFYVQVPGDKPLQIELLDKQGKALQREQGWWWARKGEQRICVGCHAGPERSPENAVPAVLVKSTKPVAMK